MPASERLFEIHPSLPVEDEADGTLLGLESPPAVRPSVVAIAESEGIVGICLNTEGSYLMRSPQPEDADLAVRVVRQRLSAYLALLCPRPGMLVNGVPAGGFTVLTSGDSLVPAPGCLCHVTERVRPYVGAPTEDLVGKKCPFCMLPLTVRTRIFVCRCGVPYHHETAETHPETVEEDRLRCFEKVRACLSCGRAIGIEEYLVWDPRSL